MSQKYLNQWNFPSKSDPSKTYTVSLKPDGEYICSCWPYLNDRSKPCKHIKAAMNANHKAQTPTISRIDVRLPNEAPNSISLQEALERLFGAKI